LTIIDKIKKEFENCSANNCIEHTKDKYFEILDDNNKKCFIVKDKIIKGNFQVKNQNQNEISFIAIDKCLFTIDDMQKKCDFALCNNYEFSFVEIKEPSSVSGRKALRNDAVEQLKATIEYFFDKKIFETFKINIEAIICLVGKKSYPSLTSSKIKRVKEFQDLYSVNLIEGNFKIY